MFQRIRKYDGPLIKTKLKATLDKNFVFFCAKNYSDNIVTEKNQIINQKLESFSTNEKWGDPSLNKLSLNLSEFSTAVRNTSRKKVFERFLIIKFTVWFSFIGVKNRKCICSEFNIA